MEVRNRTPFAAAWLVTLDKQAAEHMVVVLKGTYAVRQDGTLSLLEKQPPPRPRSPTKSVFWPSPSLKTNVCGDAENAVAALHPGISLMHIETTSTGLSTTMRTVTSRVRVAVAPPSIMR